MKYLILTAFLVLSSCGRTKPVTKVDAITATEPKKEETSEQVAIPLSFLSKKLILNIAYQGLDKQETLKSLPAGYLQAKIVYLKIKNNYLYLFEDSKLSSSSDLIADKLLYSFKIIHKNADKLFIDFEEGFKSIDSTLGHDSNKNIEVILKSNYLKEFKLSHHKISLISSSTLISQTNTLSHLDIHFSLQELTSNKNFSPTIYNKKEKSYFFTTQPVRVENQKELVQYIVKHDISKTIIYTLSSRIPKEYLAAISEGVLYWNKVLGKNFISIQNESSQVLSQNRIEWINDEDTHFCYGLSEINPLSGEITGSTIYLNSGFFSGYTNRFKLQNIYETDQDKESLTNNQLLSMLISTVSHEVGHTLGLRHNFMGNTEANLEKSIPSSTVMDYLSEKLDIAMGEMIHHGHEVGKYDQEIIQKLYGVENSSQVKSTFCTDEDTKILLNCRQYDTYSHELQESINDLSLNEQPLYFIMRNFNEPSQNIVESDVESNKIIKRFKRIIDSIDLEKKINIIGVNTDEEKFHYIQKGFELIGGEKTLFQLFINEKGFFQGQHLLWQDSFKNIIEFLPEEKLVSPNWLQVEEKMKEELLDLLANYNGSYFLSRYNSDESRIAFENFCAQLAEEIIIKNPSLYSFTMKKNAIELLAVKNTISFDKYPMSRFFNEENNLKMENYLTSKLKDLEDSKSEDIKSKILKREFEILITLLH